MQILHHRFAQCALGLGFFIGASALIAATPASGKERAIKCELVPAEVRTAFAKAYPNAVIEACAEEEEKGRTVYEVTSTDGKTKRDVLYNDDGTLIVVEETIALGELPEAVRMALTKSYPIVAIERVEKLMRDGTVSYELRFKWAGKLEEVVFDDSGKEVKH